jgi:hypothetical protein
MLAGSCHSNSNILGRTTCRKQLDKLAEVDGTLVALPAGAGAAARMSHLG